MDAAPVRFIELFHLLFLAQLVRRVDARLFVVKGGCNLRFFLRSLRYSEDMDLDAGEIAVTTLRYRVREVFASRPFADILEARGIRLERVTEHKQTDTTQRWKLGLRIDGVAVPLPTKIEFSRRGLDDDVEFGSVDASVARAHQLPGLMVSHYGAAAAFRQKVGALAGRRETQARDVFDLHHLQSTIVAAQALASVEPPAVERACTNALTVDFGMFKSQVLAFLPLEDQAAYNSAAVWETIVLEVVEALGGGRR